MTAKVKAEGEGGGQGGSEVRKWDRVRGFTHADAFFRSSTVSAGPKFT